MLFTQIEPGQSFAPLTRSIYIKTTNAAGAQMTITDPLNNGNMTNGVESIPVTYEFNGEQITLGVPFTLTTTTDDGSVPVGDFIITPAVTGGAQSAGTYSVALTILVEKL